MGERKAKPAAAKRVRFKPAPGQGPRPRGRQPKDRDALDRAVLICLERGMLPQEVAELPEMAGPDGKPLVAWRTVYERLERRRRAMAKAEDAAPAALAVREVEAELVTEELGSAPVAEPLAGERAQRAELIRRMAADGQLDHEAAGRLAATFGCSEDEALAAIRDADRVAAGKALPRHLALEASLGAYRRMLTKAEAANDWRNATMIQAQIDKLLGVVPGSRGSASPEPGAGWVRASDVKVEVEAMVRRLWAALAAWPAAQTAFRTEYQRGRATL